MLLEMRRCFEGKWQWSWRSSCRSSSSDDSRSSSSTMRSRPSRTCIRPVTCGRRACSLFLFCLCVTLTMSKFVGCTVTVAWIIKCEIFLGGEKIAFCVMQNSAATQLGKNMSLSFFLFLPSVCPWCELPQNVSCGGANGPAWIKTDPSQSFHLTGGKCERVGILKPGSSKLSQHSKTQKNYECMIYT